MMDYEAPSPSDIDALYAAEAPPYAEVCCATGARSDAACKAAPVAAAPVPDAFARARWHLTSAQYVAWRLGGRPASEISQIAAQGHLWDPRSGRFSSLVRRNGFERLYPPMARAGEQIGCIAPVLAARAGLAPDTAVLCGVHDSNANLFRYKAAGLQDRTVLSTGTWMIGFERQCPLDRLDAESAMVSNVDVDGAPVASTLTMTGREHALIAAGAVADDAAVEAVLPGLVARGTCALPSFCDSDGLFARSAGRGEIVGPPPETDAERRGVAALYAALTAHACLDRLGSRAPIVVDGGFATNRAFGRLLAALRPDQPVSMSRCTHGTALGAALLPERFTRREPVRTVVLDALAPLPVPGLLPFAARFARLAARQVSLSVPAA